MKKTHTIIVSLILICAMAINFSGCTTTKVHAKDLMEGIVPNKVVPMEDLGSKNAIVTDFAVRLFRASHESGKNTLISPLSALCALAMTANGADGETLSQMENVLGMSADELSLYFYSYMQSLSQGEKYKLCLANSIWLAESKQLSIKRDFLQKNADYFGADIYSVPFDEQTLADINNWVSEKTDKMIPNIIDEFPDNMVMYLINALAFDAEWEDVYTEGQVRDGKFTNEDRTSDTVTYMYSTEWLYLEDENAVGFMKPYNDGGYAFVAMLPSEGVSVSEYLNSLDGSALYSLLSSPSSEKVLTSIPKFETDYSAEMSEILKNMGIVDAFDGALADFGGISDTEDGIYISRVLHKTHISVAEQGTRAGAATVVEVIEECAPTIGARPSEPKKVYLDRPFVYMIVDLENNIPFFIGTMTDVG